MTLPVSVVIVSRDRPEMLRRCLTAVAQLQYAMFEVVVAADPSGLRVVDELDPDRVIKKVPFDVPNISRARNEACNHASGEIIAFIDDDAVPEPTWLRHLAAPFQRSHVGIAGGFVRGRNGISWQWKARQLTETGVAQTLTVDETKTTVFAAPALGAIKTEGTNMAVRRQALVDLGGFDPAFHFFLDETDLNMRAARAGWATAIAPLAQVHHGYAASVRRRADRAPKSLFDIGASWSVFWRKHVPEAAQASARLSVEQTEKRRALQWMQGGGLDALDVALLMRSLNAGFTKGAERSVGEGAVLEEPASDFSKMPASQRQSHVLQGWFWQRKTLMERAKTLREAGDIVTIILLSPTALFHRHVFAPDGFWLQTGGVWGRSDRSDRLVALQTKARRLSREIARIGLVRGLSGEKM